MNLTLRNTASVHLASLLVVNAAAITASSCSAGCNGTIAVNVSESVVLFGGASNLAGSTLGDTWTWDGNAWTKREVSGPSPRGSSATLLGNEVVLFGGAGDRPAGEGTTPNPVLSDTWTWDGSGQWTQHNVAGPPARGGSVMASLNGVAVLYGGAVPNGAGAIFLSDTWTWDGNTWTQVDVPGPPARAGAAMCRLGDKLVLFGGWGTPLQAGQLPNPFSDTWTWDGATWTQMKATGPSSRVAPEMAALGNVVVLFSGADDSGTPSDTWTWDGAIWTQLMVQGPAGRQAAAVATLNGKIMMFGGTIGNQVTDETWLWDGASWTQAKVPGPSGRYSSAIAGP